MGLGRAESISTAATGKEGDHLPSTNLAFFFAAVRLVVLLDASD